MSRHELRLRRKGRFSLLNRDFDTAIWAFDGDADTLPLCMAGMRMFRR